MRVLIDGQEASLAEVEGDFPSIVEQITLLCSSNGRVVTELRVNGNALEPISEEKVAGVSVESIETLGVLTQSMPRVAVEVLRSSGDHIPRLIEGCSQVAATLQSGRIREGMSLVESVLTFWLEILQGTDTALRTLGLDFNSVALPSEGFDETPELTAEAVISEINSLLEETQRAFENVDNLEIGDILEYDLPPLLEAFRECLYRLADKGEATHGPVD